MNILSFFNKKFNRIDKRKVAANLFVLKNGSYGVAESFSRFDKAQEKLIKFATKSIKKIDPLGGLPLGFPLEFVAAYPDVVLWWNALSDEEQEKLFKGINENDFFDIDRKIKRKYLMIIVEAYKAGGFELECLR